jgi:hypothetical protein
LDRKQNYILVLILFQTAYGPTEDYKGELSLELVLILHSATVALERKIPQYVSVEIPAFSRRIHVYINPNSSRAHTVIKPFEGESFFEPKISTLPPDICKLNLHGIEVPNVAEEAW